MGIWARFRARRQIQRSKALALEGRQAEAFAALEPTAGAHGAWVWAELGDRLLEADSVELAREAASRALAVDPDNWSALVTVGSLDERAGLFASAIKTYFRLHKLRPGHLEVASVLGDLLLKEGRSDRAVEVTQALKSAADPRHRVLHAKALFAARRSREALEVLHEVVGWYDQQLRHAQFGGDVPPQEMQEARALHSEALASLHGREAVAVDQAVRHGLDARAGVNFRLLAASLMVRSVRLAPSLALESAAETERAGREILGSEPTSAIGLVQLGIAALRSRHDREALAHFEAAHEADPTNFAAELGRGAALEYDQKGLDSLVSRLKDREPPPGLVEVVPDWPVLNSTERRVVCASVFPLRSLLPKLAAQGCRILILPIDVRPTDLPELAELRGERHEDDHRSWEAVGGLAGAKLACAKVEDLLHVGADGWVFAHEFAHLAERALPPAAREALERLFEDARRHEYAFEQYQLGNLHEFFAVSYADYLTRRSGFPLNRELDEDGQLARVFEFFDGLS